MKAHVNTTDRPKSRRTCIYVMPSQSNGSSNQWSCKIPTSIVSGAAGILAWEICEGMLRLGIIYKWLESECLILRPWAGLETPLRQGILYERPLWRHSLQHRRICNGNGHHRQMSAPARIMVVIMKITERTPGSTHVWRKVEKKIPDTEEELP